MSKTFAIILVLLSISCVYSARLERGRTTNEDYQHQNHSKIKASSISEIILLQNVEDNDLIQENHINLREQVANQQEIKKDDVFSSFNKSNTKSDSIETKLHSIVNMVSRLEKTIDIIVTNTLTNTEINIIKEKFERLEKNFKQWNHLKYQLMTCKS